MMYHTCTVHGALADVSQHACLLKAPHFRLQLALLTLPSVPFPKLPPYTLCPYTGLRCWTRPSTTTPPTTPTHWVPFP